MQTKQPSIQQIYREELAIVQQKQKDFIAAQEPQVQIALQNFIERENRIHILLTVIFRMTEKQVQQAAQKRIEFDTNQPPPFEVEKAPIHT